MRFHLLAAAAIAVSAGASPPQDDGTKEFVCANEQLAHGEYLKATDLLFQAVPDDKNPNGMLHQFASQVIPFLTGEPGIWPPSNHLKPSQDQLRQLGRADLHDAIDEIVERARDTNIVILNEAHGVPRDRAFALEVARALRPLGYSYLAAEAFASSVDPAQRQAKAKALSEAGYARLTTGFYTKDPVFGDFVRQSLAIGYQPIVYEYMAKKGAPPPDDPIGVRDQGEAENLVSAIFASKPTAKVLIYVGYEHAAEAKSSDHEWLAARLKRMTGIDPLTIDQTSLSASAFGSDRSLYAALKPRIGRNSVVPMLGGQPLTVGKMADVVDLEVAHPPERSVRGRPDWLAAMGRKPAEIPARLLPASGRVLVQAFVDGEADDAIPVDQVVVTAGRKPPPLMLPSRAVKFHVRASVLPGDCASAPAK